MFRHQHTTPTPQCKILILQHAMFSQTQQESVLHKCTQAEPRHGELWCAESKAIPNWRLKTKDITPLVAKSLKPIDKE